MVLLISLAISDITVNITLSAIYSVDVLMNTEHLQGEERDKWAIFSYQYMRITRQWIMPFGKSEFRGSWLTFLNPTHVEKSWSVHP